jgi:hypothetical protein
VEAVANQIAILEQVLTDNGEPILDHTEKEETKGSAAEVAGTPETSTGDGTQHNLIL